jgi:hypothetical protein
MVVGNVVAIAQTNIKRMLAYSTISHVGFILLGVLAGNVAGYRAAMFYTLTYVIMATGGFGVVLLMSRKGFEAELLDDYKGLNRKNPWFAFVMLLLMFGMAGVPPTVGFWAKIQVISAVLDIGLTWLAALAVVLSVIGAYYYLRIVKLMYFDEPASREPLEAGTSRIEDRIRLREMRPFSTDYRTYLTSHKTIFNKIVGEPNSGGFELRFASFLEDAPDVQAFAKNYFAVGFKLDYVKAHGDLANYTPDFVVRTSDGVVWIVETKGRQELDLPQKMARLKQWCADATAAEENGQRYDFVLVDQIGFGKHEPSTFAALTASFMEFKS